ncbi:MAG: hypothetical protein AAGH87_05850 [Pseudomonadota bacterium]
MTQRDRDSLAWSLDFAARRLAAAFALAAPSGALGPYLARAAWRAACREVQYLELFVRRLLVCMAAGMKIRAPLATAPREALVKAQPAPPPAAERAARPAPLLPVFDRQPSWAELKRQLACWEDGESPPISDWTHRPKAYLAPMVDARRLAARFAALARALEAPERPARRLARWMARAEARRRQGAGPRPALHVMAIPSLARGRDLDLDRSAFLEAKRLALEALDRRWRHPGPAPPA